MMAVAPPFGGIIPPFTSLLLAVTGDYTAIYIQCIIIKL